MKNREQKFEEENTKSGRFEHKLNDRERILYHKRCIHIRLSTGIFINSIQSLLSQ